MTVHTRSRLNDINITKHYSVAFNALKKIDSDTTYILKRLRTSIILFLW